MHAVYLHGFASGPGSTKARFFAERLRAQGIAVEVPDLAPDFTHMTITSMLAIVDPLLGRAGNPPALVLGSSLGGYLAALAAAQWPDRVGGLVLFAPAFAFGARWEAEVGPKGMARWRERGTANVFHYGRGREEPLSIALLDDAARHAAQPEPACPALVLHGRRDDAVPLAVAEAFAAGHPARELVVYDAGHELTEVLEPMWARVQAFVARLG